VAGEEIAACGILKRAACNSKHPIQSVPLKVYDRQRFLEGGFRHHELYFPDGSCPPTELLLRFLEIAEQVRGWSGWMIYVVRERSDYVSRDG
jgi:hypothetical protein